ncbi:MAG: sulfur carrier protein ThiS [Candidatus Omnitrophica bacterium]|nr:sulfur carrier protein ThiS [Candidatus Omnitrophota bacterium]MBI2174176.1 sulfur carrier protein ThiS [Candidatus Omnitrophota bacterium]MBI3009468.1 sulfur carrier protein ThiS [Candidatus Omnitrophota bacterium]
MQLTVNGEVREVPEGTNVLQLLEQLQVAPERVVVEVNLDILKRAQHASLILKAQDRVEIVQFVGGG